MKDSSARVVSFALHGIGVSGGIAIGRAQLVSHATREVAHYTIPLAQVPSEIERFTAAIGEVKNELEALHAALTSGDAPGEFDTLAEGGGMTDVVVGVRGASTRGPRAEAGAG